MRIATTSIIKSQFHFLFESMHRLREIRLQKETPVLILYRPTHKQFDASTRADLRDKLHWWPKLTTKVIL